MSDVEKIATYLNVATDKLKNANGNLQWLTGTTTQIEVSTGASQETQCMSFGAAFWIANNDDADTVIQRLLLNQLGITSYTALLNHVNTHGKRALDTHGKFVVQTQLSPKKKFLKALLGGDNKVPAVCTPDQTAANLSYTLPVNGSMPPQAHAPSHTQIVFVRGTYDGDVDPALHAEQKLLAALGVLVLTNRDHVASPIRVAGCKAACGTCRTALTGVAQRLQANYKKVLSWKTTTDLNSKRSAAGIGVDNNSGIKLLDVDHYFPPDPPNKVPQED